MRPVSWNLTALASTVTDGNQPLTSEVLAEATLPPAASRVPARP